MAERIELPPQLQGDEKRQLQQLWSYLYQLSESINNNLEGIGSNELTDAERATMQAIVGEGERQGLSEMESLKSLIIKTADFVQTSLTEYRLNLLGSTVASGQFGRYVRNTGLDVAVTPEGITQNYSFEEVVQGLKEFSINAKNYIKTGLLRMVGSIPVYGVAIGKDVVTFSEDGTETYNDGNKVAELTADELSFWQNGVKVAGYTGNRISFYYGGTEVFYIANGKVYCAQDLEITSGKKLIINSGVLDVNTANFSINSNLKNITIGDWILDQNGLVGILEDPNIGIVHYGFGNNALLTGGGAGVSFRVLSRYSSGKEYETGIIYLQDTNSHYSRLMVEKNDYGVMLLADSSRNNLANGLIALRNHFTVPKIETTDLNNCVEPGIYIINSSLANLPSGYSGYATWDLFVESRMDEATGNAVKVYQTLYTTIGEMFKRIKRNDTWTSWYKFTGTAV